MALGTINARLRVKHMWLLKAINIPLILLGLDPWIPKFCIGIELIHGDPDDAKPDSLFPSIPKPRSLTL